jgi:hypothetical protein
MTATMADTRTLHCFAPPGDLLNGARKVSRGSGQQGGADCVVADVRLVVRALPVVTLIAAVFAGCVTVYQPLMSLQRPAVVDPQLANFQGRRFLVRCVSDAQLAPSDAQGLCLKLRSLFAVQGAEVAIEVPIEGMPGGGVRATEQQPDLTIELRSRLVHEANNRLLWILSVASLTLVPTIAELTFVQDVTIRDGSGFVLASDSLQGRFINYFGFGIWAVNSALDFLVRSQEEKLTGKQAHQEFTRDFYRQISQLTFDAHMRSMVLRGFQPQPAPAAEQARGPAGGG